MIDGDPLLVLNKETLTIDVRHLEGHHTFTDEKVKDVQDWFTKMCQHLKHDIWMLTATILELVVADPDGPTVQGAPL